MSTGGTGSAHNPTIVTESKKLDQSGTESEDQPTTDDKNPEE